MKIISVEGIAEYTFSIIEQRYHLSSLDAVSVNQVVWSIQQITDYSSTGISGWSERLVACCS